MGFLAETILWGHDPCPSGVPGIWALAHEGILVWLQELRCLEIESHSSEAVVEAFHGKELEHPFFPDRKMATLLRRLMGWLGPILCAVVCCVVWVRHCISISVAGSCTLVPFPAWSRHTSWRELGQGSFQPAVAHCQTKTWNLKAGK